MHAILHEKRYSFYILMGSFALLFLSLCTFLATKRTSITDPMTPDRANAQVTVAQGMPAFPGAEGFGSTTIGGRGGKIIEVTNLNDSGSGSLREALTSSGARIIVFKVGGIISLKSSIKVRNPYLTIAGQTAPGDGILIRNDMAERIGSTDYASIRINTHDVIIRGLRIRPGPPPIQGVQGDAITVETSSYSTESYAKNVIVDHNSFSWATDETASSYFSSADITWSWNIVAEGLSHSTHVDGEHSKGLFMSGDNSYNISAHHNLIAHNVRRNPEINLIGYGDVRNNVIYDWGNWAASFIDKRSSSGYNAVNNWFKEGPSIDSSDESPYEIFAYHDSISGVPVPLYISGNIRSDGSPARLNPLAKTWLTTNPAPVAYVTTTSAEQAMYDVLTYAGASSPKYDAVDTRIINDVKNGTGHVIDDPQQVGGWPIMNNGIAPDDTDHDGMPNIWEIEHGLNPTVNDSTGDIDANGYTNVEDYINSFFPSPQIVPSPTNTIPSPTTFPILSPTSTPSVVPSPTIEVYPTITPISDITPPFVSITYPMDNSYVWKGSIVTIAATATDIGGVSMVTFSVNNKLICRDTILPYSCNWSVPGKIGVRYIISAVAYDTSGNSTIRSISVTSSTTSLNTGRFNK